MIPYASMRLIIPRARVCALAPLLRPDGGHRTPHAEKTAWALIQINARALRSPILQNVRADHGQKSRGGEGHLLSVRGRS